MNTNNTETNLKRIERTSAFLRAACTGLIVLVVVVAIVAAVAVVAGRLTSINYGSQSLELAGLGPHARLVVMAVGIATAAVILNALYHLRRLLDNYSRREIFTAASARQIRQFGISCILWGVIKVVWAFLPLALLPNPPHSFGITLDSVFIGAVIIGISWFAELATNLREENDLTI